MVWVRAEDTPERSGDEWAERREGKVWYTVRTVYTPYHAIELEYREADVIALIGDRLALHTSLASQANSPAFACRSHSRMGTKGPRTYKNS